VSGANGGTQTASNPGTLTVNYKEKPFFKLNYLENIFLYEKITLFNLIVFYFCFLL